MKKFLGWIGQYWKGLNKGVFWSSVLTMGVMIYLNYHFDLYWHVSNSPDFYQFFFWAGLFSISFGFSYIMLILLKRKNYGLNAAFPLLFFFAIVLFAWKVSADISFNLTPDLTRNAYYNQVVYWPAKMVAVLAALFLVNKLRKTRTALQGVTAKNFSLRPYFLMLLVMLPLIALASTQHDFQAIYPKYYRVEFLKHSGTSPFYKLLYELSYGCDFISIEVFFRGFLVLAFAKWFGEDAILPMAMFYCTIHFGKPLGECISSFFGGVILGVVTYRTGSVVGGLIVHLGIAWLMELGGHLGHQFMF